MLPSLLTRDIQDGIKQFLVTGFEPSDAHLHGLMSRFVDEAQSSAWLKGPFVQMGLPFRHGRAGKHFFPGFELKFPGYSHQERAWTRLRSGDGHAPANTLVATGTGSGKTECFLYPVMDDAARRQAAGEGGIKALIIYPMNALATDQARRIASLVDGVPAFAKLRVGLFVGGSLVALYNWCLMASGASGATLGEAGEEWTSNELRRLRRHGWKFVNGLQFRVGDIDHVAVGPDGVVVIESKWTSMGVDLDRASDWRTIR